MRRVAALPNTPVGSLSFSHYALCLNVCCHCNEQYLTYSRTKIEAEDLFSSSTWSKAETHVELVVLYLVEGVSSEYPHWALWSLPYSSYSSCLISKDKWDHTVCYSMV